MDKISFNTVTGYSKLAAIIFFIGVLPALTFYIGMRYKEVKILEGINYTNKPNNLNSTYTVSMNSKSDKSFPNERCIAFFQSPKVELGDPISLPIECSFNMKYKMEHDYEDKAWKFKVEQVSKDDAQVEISAGENIVQKIVIKNYHSDFPNEIKGLTIGDAQINIGEDYNLDGWKDIRVTSEIGASNVFFDYWLFNEEAGKFEKDPVLTNLANSEFKNDKITSYLIQGVNGYTVTTYDFVDGSYQKGKVESVKK